MFICMCVSCCVCVGGFIYFDMHSYVNSCGTLVTNFRELTGTTGFRNDINHCGFKEGYLSPEKLEEKYSSFSHIMKI